MDQVPVGVHRPVKTRWCHDHISHEPGVAKGLRGRATGRGLCSNLIQKHRGLASQGLREGAQGPPRFSGDTHGLGRPAAGATLVLFCPRVEIP